MEIAKLLEEKNLIEQDLRNLSMDLLKLEDVMVRNLSMFILGNKEDLSANMLVNILMSYIT